MSWAVTAISMVVISTGVSAYSSYSQGQAQKKMNQYNADVAAQQAKIEAKTAETNITMVQNEAAEEAKIQRRNLAAVRGEQKGILAASGVWGDSVTATDIEKTTLDTAELDREAIRYKADSKSFALKTGSDADIWNLKTQEGMYSMAGKNAARAGNIGAASSLLEGASKVANFTYKGNSKSTSKKD